MHVQTILDNVSHLGPAQPPNGHPPALSSSSSAQPQAPELEAIPAAVEQPSSWLENTAYDAEQPRSVVSQTPGPSLLPYACLKAEELQGGGPLLPQGLINDRQQAHCYSPGRHPLLSCREQGWV